MNKTYFFTLSIVVLLVFTPAHAYRKKIATQTYQIYYRFVHKNPLFPNDKKSKILKFASMLNFHSKYSSVRFKLKKVNKYDNHKTKK